MIKNTANTRALLMHLMKTKQQHIGSAIQRSLKYRQQSREREDGVSMTETRMYIGLNDADTGEQLHETEKYLGQLKSMCRRYKVPFSVDVENGGYYHEDGRYIEEVSLVLVLIDADKDVVRNIARDICALFHQESVLVTEDQLGGYFINGETN